MPVQIKTALLSAFICLSVTADGSGQQMPQTSVRYAQSVMPTPVLNTPEFSSIFAERDVKTAHPDAAGLLRELEFIALPDTVFTIEKVIRQEAATLYRVTTVDYPYPSPNGYYIDSRFVRTSEERPPDRVKHLPDKNAIIASLLASAGSRYLWGGNIRDGIPQMLSFFPSGPPLTQDERDRWILKGLDCSGLLYGATEGWTPRNTSSLISFGESLPITHLTLPQIIQAVKPLDMIVWAGHVIIILDQERVIESRLDYDEKQAGNQGGVRIRKIGEVLTEVLKERIPVNSYNVKEAPGQKQFVIRRWYK